MFPSLSLTLTTSRHLSISTLTTLEGREGGMEGREGGEGGKRGREGGKRVSE